MPDSVARNDVAVLVCCDAAYLPYALHLVWQFATRYPARQFDIVVGSEVVLELPDWALRLGIGNLHLGHADWIDGMPTARLGRAAYLRLVAPEMLERRYRRLLYLDCDVYLESGDIDRLLRVSLGHHAIAAVRDVNWINDPGYHAPEFQALGLGPLPYFNAGVLLIDTAAFLQQDLLAKGLAAAKDHPAVMRIQDQSLLNAAVAGRFAEFAPGWNWMANSRLPFALQNLAIRFRHFIGPVKPWSDPTGRYDRRFHDSYEDFFRCLMPDQQARLTPRPPVGLTGLESAVRLVIAQARQRKCLEAVFRRFSDEWDVKI